MPTREVYTINGLSLPFERLYFEVRRQLFSEAKTSSLARPLPAQRLRRRASICLHLEALKYRHCCLYNAFPLH